MTLTTFFFLNKRRPTNVFCRRRDSNYFKQGETYGLLQQHESSNTVHLRAGVWQWGIVDENREQVWRWGFVDENRERARFGPQVIV